jgi:hypothetical protein
VQFQEFVANGPVGLYVHAHQLEWVYQYGHVDPYRNRFADGDEAT